MISKIDIERTRDEYRRQLDAFMKSFIMTCSPYDEDKEILMCGAEERKQQYGLSWIENAMGFCSFRKIESIIHIYNSNVNPYDVIRLAPQRDMLTSNWFKWECRPVFEKRYQSGRALELEYGAPTR